MLETETRQIDGDTIGGCQEPTGMSMKNFSQNEPLTEAELDRLRKFLKNCKGGKAGLGIIDTASGVWNAGRN